MAHRSRKNPSHFSGNPDYGQCYFFDVPRRVGHGLDSSTDWIGLDWVGLDWVILCNTFCGLDCIGSDGEK